MLGLLPSPKLHTWATKQVQVQALLPLPRQPDVLQQNQLIGLAGLLLVAGITAVEAARAAKQAQAQN